MIDEVSGDLLQWLRGFYFVAEKGNLQQAAIAMGREKATISRQIQCLEKELGVTLFDRSSGKMMITSEGKILQGKADSLFEYLKEIKDEFKNAEINYRGTILIATTQGVLYNLLPPYVDHFQRLHPKVTFQCEGADREMVYEKVESAEADFGIAFSETGYKTLVCRDLYEDGLILVAPKNNPFFSGKTRPTLKQIAEAPLILFTHQGLHERMIERQFAKYRLEPNVVMRHNNFLTIKKYVACGMGVAILGEIAISKEDEQTFDVFSLEQYFPKRTIGIILKKNKYLSAMVKAFIRTIKPDIDFSANEETPVAPVLSLTEFLRRQAGLNQADAPMAGREKKR
jgi:LysR family cys regulon transcriptional activator